MNEGACHCGAIRLTLPSTPTVATDCNCSLCRRIGGVWAYFEFGSVRIDAEPGAMGEYVWGDRTLRTMRCKHCGIVTHWEPLEPKPGAKHGVNLRNFPPALLASVAVRKFDGADSWKFFDQLEGDLAPLPTIPPGRYRHYKGGEYEVLGVVRHSETLEPMVLYKPLYNDSGLWVRPFSMFTETIDIDGALQPRFRRV